MIKKGDKVKMLSGKDRGKTGKVSSVLSKADRTRVIVEGLNKVKKHQRPRKQGQKGQIIEVERAVDVSCVQLICPHCGKSTRIGHKIEGKVKARICKKCRAEIV
ncbi:MAG: large subunit ribosomal protein L24 [Parcubacteria group bacterium Gr01-1014_44]|nr:MAG: large subunit ribosomal protein L24 [Parcubacteria group bacterium Gr01-1014_44]